MFDDLSSASENEEECLFRSRDLVQWIQNRRCIVSKEVMDLNPWIHAPKIRHGHSREETTENEVQCCLLKWPEVDKQVETDKIEIQDVEVQFEENLHTTNTNVIFEHSAEDRILNTISNLLTAWYSTEKPAKEIRFSIKPLTKFSKILHCYVNPDKKSYILLVKNYELINLERWSLENLLKPIICKVPIKSEDDEQKLLHFSCTSKHIVVANGNEICIFQAKSILLINHIRFTELVIYSLSIQNNHLYIGSDRENFCTCKFGSNFCIEKNFQLPIKNSESSTILTIEKFEKVFIISTNTRIVLFYRETENFVDIPIDMSFSKINCSKNGQNLLIFSQEFGRAQIFSTENIEPYVYEFQFSGTEQVVDFLFHSQNLYSLTQNGQISKWIFMENKRKKREKNWHTMLKNCLSFHVVNGEEEIQKFIVITKKEVVHIILA